MHPFVMRMIAVAVIGTAARVASPPTATRITSSERFTDLPPILLPESGGPLDPAYGALGGGGSDVTVAFIVDTMGRVEPTGIETLHATDSSAARAVRGNLAALRYIPARLVADRGQCVVFNGVRAHCGGAHPAVRLLRARVVLRVQAGTAGP